MKVMVIGGGGREHAIIKKLKESKEITELYALPGNGGIAEDAVCVNISATDMAAQVKFAAENKIDYAVVAPDDPLCLGAVDELTKAGVPCFGPDKKAAIIEGSKVFSKNLMKKYGIPSAAYEIFDKPESALSYLETAPLPAVIKADGLALMLTAEGPKVIEYNCRFGDPETQVVLPLLESDLFTVMRAVTNGTLKETEVKFKNGAAACVIIASGGYPKSYQKGFEIKMDESVKNSVYVAGAEIKDGRLVTSGGRVLGVTATAPMLKEALCAAYKKAEKISFENAFYRKDIGLKALNAGKEN